MSKKLIDKDVLVAEIERRLSLLETGTGDSEVMKRVEGVIKGYKSILSFLDTLELEEVDLEKTKWSPSKRQIESLKDMLKYNIGMFNYQKFMEVNSLYEDLTHSKLFDETDKQK